MFEYVEIQHLKHKDVNKMEKNNLFQLVELMRDDSMQILPLVELIHRKQIIQFQTQSFIIKSVKYILKYKFINVINPIFFDLTHFSYFFITYSQIIY